MSDLLREYDMMIGILIAYDNQSRHQALSTSASESIEKIRDIIKKFVEKQEGVKNE